MRRLALSTLLVGALTGGPAAAAKPELVTVPMATLGTRASEGMEAWKIVDEAFGNAKGRLGVSLGLQKRRHDFVVGPAREQVTDCAFSIDCLQGVGGALGADILVAGQVTPKTVRLVAVEVASGRVLSDVETPPELASAPLGSRASAAARLLVGDMIGPEEPDDPVAAVPGAEPSSGVPGAEPSSGVPGAEPSSGVPGAEPSSGVPGAEPATSSAGELKGFEDPPPPPSPSAAMQGTLRIAASQLRGVSRVALDGEPLSFSGDGSIEWRGAPGDHRLVAEKSDGARLARNVFLEPGSATNVVLEWPGVTPPPPPPTASTDERGGSVLSKWWFWTSIGAAVAAGTTTAVLLASGDKGGPTLPNATGRIRGTY